MPSQMSLAPEGKERISDMSVDVVLSMRNIVKKFPGVTANDDVSLTVRRRSIHALIGENGAGKSTLMNILCGLLRPDSGSIYIESQEVHIRSTYDAISMGIGMVHQHFMLVSDLTVLENIILGADTPHRSGLTDYARGRREVIELMDCYDFHVNLDRKIYELSVGEMQRVEIIKALYRGAEILILDEPTAVLTPSEAQQLFEVLRSLAEMGKTILFISHKLREVLAISDEITVMRQGKVTGSLRTSDANEIILATMMVGRDVVLHVHKEPATPGEELLNVERLAAQNDGRQLAVKGVSFCVRAGEILGIAGVDGNGQLELVEVLTGMRKQAGGSIRLLENDITNCSCLQKRRAGIAHIPSDRMVFGINRNCSMQDNLMLPIYNVKPYCVSGIMRKGRIESYAAALVERFRIVAASLETLVCHLSGGNMQKVVVARELSTSPHVLIAAQPTRGVDVGAIEFIHNEIITLRDQGKGVLLVSMELDEVLSLSDRVLVFYEGEIVAEFINENLDELEVGLYMTGAKRMERIV